MPLERNQFPSVPPTPYADLRPQLRSGDVLLCSGNGIFSNLIQRATRSVWSHVGLILRVDAIDRVMLLESLEPVGVRTVRLSKYLTNYANDHRPYPGKLAVIRHLELDAHAADPSSGFAEMARWAVDRFGYPYDKEQILKIAARITADRMRFSKGERDRLDDNGAYICSEYVARCFAEIGIDIPWSRKGFIAPADFACAGCFALVATLSNEKVSHTSSLR